MSNPWKWFNIFRQLLIMAGVAIRSAAIISITFMIHDHLRNSSCRSWQIASLEWTEYEIHHHDKNISESLVNQRLVCWFDARFQAKSLLPSYNNSNKSNFPYSIKYLGDISPSLCCSLAASILLTHPRVALATASHRFHQLVAFLFLG